MNEVLIRLSLRCAINLRTMVILFEQGVLVLITVDRSCHSFMIGWNNEYFEL